jgi:multidrug efflux pump subunit AcrA (membrane-fusion protein)
MKIIKTTVILIVLVSAVGVLFGCGGNSDETSKATSAYTVARGDLRLDISAAGNLALSHTEDLTADLFYQQGTITEVLIEEGDSVKEGQVLVKIDADEWQEQIGLLEDALTTSQRQVETRERGMADAERQVENQEYALTAAQRNISSKDIQLREAEVNLEAAQYALNSINEVKELQDKIDYKEALLEFIDLKIVEANSPGANPLDITFWWNERMRAERDLEDAIQERNAILAGNSLTVSDTVALEVVRKQLAIEKVQLALEDAQDALAEANLGVEDAEAAIITAKTDAEYAQLDLADARAEAENVGNALEEALMMSPEITAPFDGFITKVNVEGGDTVLKGTVAVQLADPNEFKANILVSEMDIFQVEVGTSATIQVDALGDVLFPATVTSIAPTATIQSGVVNYDVAVELQSLEVISWDINDRRQQMFDDLEPGELPEMLQQAVDSGMMTQEEAEERWEQMQSGDFSPPEDFTLPEGAELPEGGGFGNLFDSGQQSEGQLPSTTITDFQLREGLSVTVSIIISERTDVILVPNGAITTQGGQTFVQVLSADGTTTEREVTTGISDWQYTEITDGLTEGEQVVVPEGTTTTSTETQFGRPGGNIIFPGGF